MNSRQELRTAKEHEKKVKITGKQRCARNPEARFPAKMLPRMPIPSAKVLVMVVSEGRSTEEEWTTSYFVYRIQSML